MGEDIEQRLASATAQVHRHHTTTARVHELLGRQLQLEAQVEELRTALAAEERDVERLKTLTVTRILASLRNTREDQLAQERAEADAARYRVAETERQLETVRQEVATAQAELATLADAPAMYDGALAVKERHLADTNDPRAARLRQLAEERGRLTGQVQELTEALDAAHTAHGALRVLNHTLNSAKQWSTYDTFFDGGIVGSLVKHDRLDKATRQARHADECLLLLRTELADVDGTTPLATSVAVDGMTRWLDIWFDNPFTDFSVRGRILAARDRAVECTTQVTTLIDDLMSRREAARQRSSELDGERAAILTSG